MLTVCLSRHIARGVDDALHGGVSVQPLHVHVGAPHVAHHQVGLVAGGQGPGDGDGQVVAGGGAA